MPHLIVDYSGNLEKESDIAGLCEALREAAADTGSLPAAGIRVRAHRADHYAIADGDPKHGFVDITVRLREGRSEAVKQSVAATVFAAAEAFLAPVMAYRSLALSLELREIDAALAPKTGNIRDHLAGASRNGRS